MLLPKVPALPFSSTRDQQRSFLLIITGVTVKVFSPEKMISPPAILHLRQFPSLWQRSKRLAHIAVVSSDYPTMAQNLPTNFATEHRTVAATIPNLVSCWHMYVKRLLRMAIRKLSLFTTSFGPLPAGPSKPLPSSKCLLITYTVVEDILSRFAISPGRCPAQRSPWTCIRLYCWEDILKYTTIPRLFFDVTFTRFQVVKVGAWEEQPDNQNINLKVFSDFFGPSSMFPFIQKTSHSSMC